MEKKKIRIISSCVVSEMLKIFKKLVVMTTEVVVAYKVIRRNNGCAWWTEEIRKK